MLVCKLLLVFLVQKVILFPVVLIEFRLFFWRELLSDVRPPDLSERCLPRISCPNCNVACNSTNLSSCSGAIGFNRLPQDLLASALVLLIDVVLQQQLASKALLLFELQLLGDLLVLLDLQLQVSSSRGGLLGFFSLSRSTVWHNFFVLLI